MRELCLEKHLLFICHLLLYNSHSYAQLHFCLFVLRDRVLQFSLTLSSLCCFCFSIPSVGIIRMHHHIYLGWFLCFWIKSWESNLDLSLILYLFIKHVLFTKHFSSHWQYYSQQNRQSTWFQKVYTLGAQNSEVTQNEDVIWSNPNVHTTLPEALIITYSPEQQCFA